MPEPPKFAPLAASFAAFGAAAALVAALVLELAGPCFWEPVAWRAAVAGGVAGSAYGTALALPAFRDPFAPRGKTMFLLGAMLALAGAWVAFMIPPASRTAFHEGATGACIGAFAALVWLPACRSAQIAVLRRARFRGGSLVDGVARHGVRLALARWTAALGCTTTFVGIRLPSRALGATVELAIGASMTAGSLVVVLWAFADARAALAEVARLTPELPLLAHARRDDEAHSPPRDLGVGEQLWSRRVASVVHAYRAGERREIVLRGNLDDVRFALERARRAVVHALRLSAGLVAATALAAVAWPLAKAEWPVDPEPTVETSMRPTPPAPHLLAFFRHSTPASSVREAPVRRP